MILCMLLRVLQWQWQRRCVLLIKMPYYSVVAQWMIQVVSYVCQKKAQYVQSYTGHIDALHEMKVTDQNIPCEVMWCMRLGLFSHIRNWSSATVFSWVWVKIWIACLIYTEVAVTLIFYNFSSSTEISYHRVSSLCKVGIVLISPTFFPLFL
jgi:hypothetical protein